MGRHSCVLFILFIIGMSGCLQNEHVVQGSLESVWRYQGLPSDTSHPFFCLCEDRLIFHWHMNILYCLSIETGDLLWNYISPGNFQGDIDCKERKIFVCSKEGVSQIELICLNVDTAEVIWKKSDIILQEYACTSTYVYLYQEGLS